jgi:hypothetical protein
VEEQEILNLDAHQRRQAQDSMTRSNATVDLRLREAYSWLLVPAQEAGGAGTCATRVWASAASRSSHQMSTEVVRWYPGLRHPAGDRAPHAARKPTATGGGDGGTRCVAGG